MSNAFYKQYDDFVINFNEKFAKPGQKIMKALCEQKLLTASRIRRRDRMDVVLAVAPRRPPGPARRVDDGARLCPLARHV